MLLFKDITRMSWSSTLPFWILVVEYEELVALWSCGFPEEINSGFLRGTPEDVIESIQQRREDE